MTPSGMAVRPPPTVRPLSSTTPTVRLIPGGGAASTLTSVPAVSLPMAPMLKRKRDDDDDYDLTWRQWWWCYDSRHFDWLHACTYSYTFWFVSCLLLRNSFNGPLSGTGDYQGETVPERKSHVDLLEQETVSGSGISWAICKSAPCPRQITMPAPHHLVFLQNRCPSCRPTNSIRALKDASTEGSYVLNRGHSISWIRIWIHSETGFRFSDTCRMMPLLFIYDGLSYWKGIRLAQWIWNGFYCETESIQIR